MLFSKSTFVLAAVALSSVASAAINAFITPAEGEVLEGGKTIPVTWKPDGGKKVKITLRKGKSTNLDTLEEIASSIDNSGTYNWIVPKDLESGADYALMITDLESEEVNYTGQFSLKTDVPAGKAPEKSTEVSKTATTAASTKTTASAEPTETVDSDDEDEEETKETKTTAASKTTAATKDDDKESTPTPSAESDNEESSAAALSKSPLAFVVCLIGAFFYLN